MVSKAGKINSGGKLQHSNLAKPTTIGFDKTELPSRMHANDPIC